MCVISRRETAKCSTATLSLLTGENSLPPAETTENGCGIYLL
ncbi:unknown [Prevotella sp. CAG:891]|nr:unknown [Prevotella sp. CAG:891]